MPESQQFIQIKDLPSKIICERCNLRVGQWRRQNTQYYDDRENWVFLCDECQEKNEAYWSERWSDYYAGLL